MAYSNRRPYYELKLSIGDFFRESVRYLKESNTKESAGEKPYLEEDYPKMHLRLPGFWYKRRPRRPGGAFGEAGKGLAEITFGEADCYWNILNPPDCIKEDQIITITANYLLKADFNFVANIVEDSIGGVSLNQLPGEDSVAWDDQDFQVSFPEGANGTVTICGFASSNVLISQTFETVVAGMPVGLQPFGKGFLPTERGQFGNPAKIVQSSFGTKGANCGCIDITSTCDPCTGITAVNWDDAASADTIARNNNVSVSVQDGLGPYNWSVTGTGFSLDNAQTVGVSNTLNADGSACGSAAITVTDQCSGSVTGYVRCTTGTWTLQAWSCPIPGAWTAHPSNYVFERISGQYKVNQVLAAAQGFNNVTCIPISSCGGDTEDCIDWSCPEIFSNWTDRFHYYCITTTPPGCAGYCMKNNTKQLYKWTC